MYMLLKYKDKFKLSRKTTTNILFRHLNVTFFKRPFFVFNSIIFYQYLTLVLACSLQFLSLYNQTNQGTYEGLNAAAAVMAFILATLYPIIHFLYLRAKALSS